MGLDQLGLQQLASQESTEADISVSLWSGWVLPDTPERYAAHGFGQAKG